MSTSRPRFPIISKLFGFFEFNVVEGVSCKKIVSVCLFVCVSPSDTEKADNFCLSRRRRSVILLLFVGNHEENPRNANREVPLDRKAISWPRSYTTLLSTAHRWPLRSEQQWER